MTANWTQTTPAGLRDVFLRTGPANTRKAYWADLRAFMEFIGARSLTAAVRTLCEWSPGEATGKMENYKAAMRDDGYAANTVRRRIGSVVALAEKAKSLDVIQWSIAIALPRVRSGRDTSGPAVAPIREMIARCQARDDAKGRRDTALLSLMYYQALRAAEVLSIDVAHYQAGRKARVTVKAKGRADRDTIELSTPASDAVDAWLQCRGTEPGRMFPTMNRGAHGGGERLTYCGLSRTIQKIAQAVGAATCRPNDLRHAAITEALRITRGNIIGVMQFSRDKDPQSVMFYLDRAMQRDREVAEILTDQGPIVKGNP